MNRAEKNLQTKRKIIDSSMLEFSEKSYGEASLNTICANGNISKGIIYHYFKDKDELYLICIKECFDALTDYLSNIDHLKDASIESALENYFDARITFFGANPLYLKIFCNALMNQPTHLVGSVAKIMENFDALNLSVVTDLLKNVKLRSDVNIEEVVDIFRKYQDFVNTRFQMQSLKGLSILEHEERCARSLKILLYGVIERKE